MTATIEGIDVSAYQGQVNWRDVYHSGRRFAGIKATEGLGYRDPTFPRNWEVSRLNGLVRIAYHFLRPEFNGAVQAKYLHDYVRMNGRFSPGDAIMCDLEVSDGMNAQQILTCAESFVLECLNETECGIFLYTGPWFWNGVMGMPTSKVLAKCPLWQAEYGPKADKLVNWPRGLSIWQYSSSGRVPGVSGLCDVDRFYGTMQQLQALARNGGRS